MHCTNCGKELKDNSNYCSSCGARVGGTGDPVSDRMQPFDVDDDSIRSHAKDFTEKSRDTFLIAYRIFLNVGLIVAIFFSSSLYFDFLFDLKSDTASFSDNWLVIFFLLPFLLLQYLVYLQLKEVDGISTIGKVLGTMFIPIIPVLIRFHFIPFDVDLPPTWYFYLITTFLCVIPYFIVRD